MTTTTWQSLGHIKERWDLDATMIYRILSIPDRPRKLLQPLKKEFKLLICYAIISCKCSII